MKLHEFCNAALVLALITVCAVPVRPEEIARDPGQNAALWYWRAFDSRSESSNLNRLRDYLQSPDEADPEEQTDREAQLARVIDDVTRAVEKPYCEFAIDYEEGLEARLPHISLFPILSDILQLDATRQINNGDSEAATDRILQLVGISNHLASEPSLIGALVSALSLSRALDAIEAGMDRQAFDADNLAGLRLTLETVDVSDPLGIESSLIGERRILAGWFRDRFGGGPEGYQRFCNELHPLIDASMLPLVGNANEEETGPFETGQVLQRIVKPEMLDPLLDKFDQAFVDIIAAMESGDPQAIQDVRFAIERDANRYQDLPDKGLMLNRELLEATETESRYGLLTALFFPNLKKVFDESQKINNRVAKLLDRFRTDQGPNE